MSLSAHIEMMGEFDAWKNSIEITETGTVIITSYEIDSVSLMSEFVVHQYSFLE